MRSLRRGYSGFNQRLVQSRCFECRLLISLGDFFPQLFVRRRELLSVLAGANNIFFRNQAAIPFEANDNRPEYLRRSVGEMTFSQCLTRQAARQWLALVMTLHLVNCYP